MTHPEKSVEEIAVEIAQECPDGMWEEMEKWLVKRIAEALRQEREKRIDIERKHKQIVEVCLRNGEYIFKLEAQLKEAVGIIEKLIRIDYGSVSLAKKFLESQKGIR